MPKPSPRAIAPETQALLDLLHARTALRVTTLLKEMGEAIEVLNGLVDEATRIENVVRALKYSGEDQVLKEELVAWDNLGAALMVEARDLRRLVDGVVSKVSHMDRLELEHETIIAAYQAAPPDVDLRAHIAAARRALYP